MNKILIKIGKTSKIYDSFCTKNMKFKKNK